MTDAPPIAVVGAGIGGLSAALFLARAGFAVTLIEKRTSVEEEGAGLQLSANASRILAAAGLGPALARRATAPERIVMRRAGDARPLAALPLGRYAKERYGAPYFVIHRADIAGLLLDAVRGEAGIRLLYGREALGHVEGETGLRLTLRSERGAMLELEAAAMIGADGLWGAGMEPLRPCGYAAWRALVPAAVAPDSAKANEVALWLAPGAHLVHYPIRGGAAINAVAVLAEPQPQEGWSRDGDASRIASALSGWNGTARDLIAAAPAWRSWSLFDRKPLRHWGKGLVTRLGDAAHPMLPFLAQGAAMAIEDAAVLAQQLAPLAKGAPRRDMANALRRYEKARRPRTAHAQREGRRNLFAYHAGWPASAVRNLILSRSSGESLLARYDWLYGWQPPSAAAT